MVGRVNTKEVLLGHLSGLDLYDFVVQGQQIPAYGRGQGPEPALVLRMLPSGIVERRVRMKEKPHGRGGVSHPLPPPPGLSRRRCALGECGPGTSLSAAR